MISEIILAKLREAARNFRGQRLELGIYNGDRRIDMSGWWRGCWGGNRPCAV
jgi:hypothetical protein